MKQFQNVTLNVDNRKQIQRQVQLILLLKPLGSSSRISYKSEPQTTSSLECNQFSSLVGGPNDALLQATL